jgi:dienelactone hydrolase
VLLLAGAGISASGNARCWVLAARRLSAAGHHVLRLDCTGVGDSPGAVPAWIPGSLAVADAGAGVEWLAQRAEKIVIIGECYGARLALAAAPCRAEVRSVLAIAPPLWDHDPAAQAPDGDPAFLAAVRATAASGVRCRFLLGYGDIDLPYLSRAIAGPLAELSDEGLVCHDVAPERLHGIASLGALHHVLNAIDLAVLLAWRPEDGSAA